MSGVWKFSPKGVMTLVENPLAEMSEPGPSSGRKVLVHCASNLTITSYELLDAKLQELGWKPYSNEAFLALNRQYHRSNDTMDLLTLPPNFGSLRTTHMYDIVVKTRSAFQVRDA